MLQDDSTSIGDWTEDEIKITAAVDTGAGDDAALPSKVRFGREVQKVIRRRQSQPLSNDDPLKPALFFLCPKPIEKLPTLREPMLDAGHKQINGRAWFVSEAVVSGYRAEIPFDEDSDIFNWVCNSLELGHIPVILVNPQVQPIQFRFYPEGLNDADNCEVWSLIPVPVTKENVHAAIDKVYEACLVTPDAQSREIKVWTSKGLPVNNAERLIQAQLRPGLSTVFKDCVIREEQPDPAGRYDLSITEQVENNIVHAILELKVLRSQGEGGHTYSQKTTDDWVSSGIKQAYAYREKQNAKWSALCCFDMRNSDTKDSCFNHINDIADKLKVECWRWFLYSSSSDYREVLAKEALSEL